MSRDEVKAADDRAVARRKKWWLAVPSVALALALFGGIRMFDAVAHTCGDAERAAFLEFPQYGGRVIQPGSDIDSGACVASFQTADHHEDVVGYYETQLEQHGWTTQGFEEGAAEGGAEPGGGAGLPTSVVPSVLPTCASSSMCSGTLDAARGGFSFSIAFETIGGSTSVVVRVNGASGS